jgi:hypothetical protein
VNTTTRFEIHVDPIWRAPMLLIGGARGQCWVDVGDAEIELRLGFNHERLPIANVAGAENAEWSMFYGLGHRLGPNGPGYVGSTSNVVEIKLKDPQDFHMLLGFRAAYGSFYVSVVDPEAFIAAIKAKIG